MTERSRRNSDPDIGGVERVVAMRSFPGAVDLDPNELSVLAAIARPRRLETAERLAQPGSPSSSMFLVLSGEVAATRGETVVRAGPGRTLGAIHALARDPRGLDLKATMPSLVLVVALDDLEDVFEELPTILDRVLRDVAGRALALGARYQRGVAAASSRVPLPARPLDVVERILFLHRCPAFSAATIDTLASLAAITKEIRVGDGEWLWRAGDPSLSAFVVVRGELELDDEKQRRTTRSPGELAGMLELLAEAPRTGGARARGDLVALAIGRDALIDAWEDHIDLGIELLRAASATLLEVDPDAT